MEIFDLGPLTRAGKLINTKTYDAYLTRDNTHSGDRQAFAQVLCVAEEAGEFVGATRRYLGLARRTGLEEDMAAELADVVIASFTAAAALGIDLEQSIVEKLDKVFSRGWSE